MLGDGIALTVTGENTVLAYLVRMFGPHATAELIRHGVIEFVGEASAPAFLVDPSEVQQSDGTSVPPGYTPMARLLYSQGEPTSYNERGLDGETPATSV